jgi:hypothetical protein
MDRSDFPSDPRTLSLPERRQWCRRLDGAQRTWQQRLRDLAEVRPDPGFPAFLLATPPFAGLAARIGCAAARRDLPVGVADELDRFVDAFRDYLRTSAGEDVFAGPVRRAS